MVHLWKILLPVIFAGLTATACSPAPDDFPDTVLLDFLINGNTVSGDGTRPTVSAITPANAAGEIALTTSIVVNFSESMALGTITANTTGTTCSGNLQVSSDGFTTCVQMSATPMASNSDKTLTLTPAAALAPGTTYRIRVTTAVTDTASNSLASQFTSATGFTTRFVLFETAAMTAGNMNGVTGIAGADTFCNGDANKPSTGTYKAMLVNAGGSTRIACTTANCGGGAAENTDWVFKANTSYYRVDGTTLVMTTNAGGVHDFATALTNSFGTGGTTYWTGLMNNWTADTRHCSDWTSSTSGGVANQGERGSDIGTTGTSISAGGGSPNCDTLRTLICVQQ